MNRSDKEQNLRNKEPVCQHAASSAARQEDQIRFKISTRRLSGPTWTTLRWDRMEFVQLTDWHTTMHLLDKMKGRDQESGSV